MAVKATEEENKLILEIDNGEFSKIKEVLEKWSFKDYQCLLRFMISLLVVNESKSFRITVKGSPEDIVPAPELIKGE